MGDGFETDFLELFMGGPSGGCKGVRLDSLNSTPWARAVLTVMETPTTALFAGQSLLK